MNLEPASPPVAIAPSPSASSVSSAYSPGLWQQDVYTLPLGLGVLGMMTTFYTDSPEATWPFYGETNNGTRNRTRHPGRVLAPYAAGLVVGTLAGTSFANPSFPWTVHLRGWMHAHLVTEITTSFAKLTFLRRRPFYDTEVQRAKTGETAVRQDDKLSFFSGHASHSFAFATYSSAIVRTYVDNLFVTIPATGALYAGAAFIASARAIDGQHHWTDVAMGAAVGMAWSYLIFNRVEQVIEENGLQRKAEVRLPDVSPVVVFDKGKPTNFALQLKVEL